MECEPYSAHSYSMANHGETQTNNVSALLGKAATDHGPVDLLQEATRLKFLPEEIAELKRLYAAELKRGLAKSPQP